MRRLRSSLVVRASDCQCTSCNGPGFDPSIRRQSGIWEAADETVLNIVRKIREKSHKNIYIKKSFPSTSTTAGTSEKVETQRTNRMTATAGTPDNSSGATVIEKTSIASAMTKYNSWWNVYCKGRDTSKSRDVNSKKKSSKNRDNSSIRTSEMQQ